MILNTTDKTQRVNILKLFEYCLNDRENLKELLELLNERVEEFLASARMYLKAKDRFSIARVSHRLRNSLLMIEARGLLDFLDVIEHECQQLDSIVFLEKLLEDFEAEYRLVQADIQQQMKRLYA
ncbi:hypothetical protein D3A96_12165 [Robertkochia marina]|nr:hypothetical protein D3A96_12165 [Robertkochia marina]